MDALDFAEKLKLVPKKQARIQEDQRNLRKMLTRMKKDYTEASEEEKQGIAIFPVPSNLGFNSIAEFMESIDELPEEF